jgi:hypothetical protein
MIWTAVVLLRAGKRNGAFANSVRSTRCAYDAAHFRLNFAVVSGDGQSIGGSKCASRHHPTIAVAADRLWRGSVKPNCADGRATSAHRERRRSLPPVDVIKRGGHG